MKITAKQLQRLGALQCERLSSNQDNFSLIDDFYNARNNSLVDTLQGEAFEEDENNRIAYIQELMQIAGCEYVFLFAADLTPYEEF